LLQSTSFENDTSGGGVVTAHHSDGNMLDETVSHDKDLTSKLEMEIQRLQTTVTVFLVL